MFSKLASTKIWKFIIQFFGNIRIYKLGIIILGESSYHIKGPHVRQILDILEPGDVLLRRYDHYLGGLAIPGYWTHAAQYVGNGEIIHMVTTGIEKQDILTFLRCDHICILRCKKKELIPNSIQKSKELYENGMDYDYLFSSTNDTLYCSEKIFYIFDKPEEIKYDKYILPDDLHCDLFEEIWIDKSAKDSLHKDRITKIKIEGS